MNFKEFELLPFEVKENSYIANTEVCDRIMQAVEAFVRRTSYKPTYLLLGFGTYFSLCITVSDQRVKDFKAPVGYVEKMSHFLGIAILIDSTYEFRVACIASNDPYMDAVNIFFHNKRLKELDTS